MSKKPVVAGSTSLKVCIYLCPSWWQEFAWTKAHLLLLVSKTTANVQNTNRLPSAFFPIVEVIPFPFFVFMPVYNLTPWHWLSPPSLSILQHFLLCVSAWECGAYVVFTDFFVWSLTVGGTDCPFLFRGPHSLVQLGQAPREDVCSTVLVRRSVCQ